jgi:methyltransferase
MTPVPFVMAAVIFGLMGGEARRAARNERTQRARGGVEPIADRSTYRAMQIVYPAAFAAMIFELALRGAPSHAALAIGATLFLAAKALKWWAIVTLGSCWTFRVIVVPGARLVHAGPYRWLRHPNYVAVAAELIGAAVMTGAILVGPSATAVFLLLMARRIRVEQRALDAARWDAAASKQK